MKTTSSIKQSLKAISDTNQITSAMRLISTSKMQKSIQKYQANSIYFNRVRACLKDILVHSPQLHHRYLERQPAGKPTFVVIAADKGLCGGYNHNILSYAHHLIRRYQDSYVITIGQEARAYFEREGVPIDVEYLHISQDPTLYHARNLAFEICNMYLNQDINEVYILYTKYISSMKQEPCYIQLLPVGMDDFADVELETEYASKLEYYPSTNEVLDVLISQYIIGIVYGALVQAYASENCQRMVAMENASKNAKEMIAKLTVQLNRARQQGVTRDITEIVGAMDALEN